MTPPAASHPPKPRTAKEDRYRARKPHSKSRRGCRTCKFRHLKCDEEKPSCNRCLSDGFCCDGYAHYDEPNTPTSRSKAHDAYQMMLSANMVKPKQKALPEIECTTSILGPGLIPFAESEQDKKCFEFFRTVTLPKVFCPFNKGFWNYLLLQLSHTEPTTWHSLLAFASITEHQPFSTATKDKPQALSARFTLNHYTRAVKLLANRISGSNPCIEVLLSSSYLFFSLEMFLGNIESAIIQIQGGLKLMQSWRKAKNGQPNSAVDNLFSPMLNIMFSCAFIYGREVTLTTHYPSRRYIPRLADFGTSYSTIVALVEFTASCWQAAREFETYKFVNVLTDYDIYLASSYQRQIRDRFREWSTKFERIIEQINTSSFNPAGLEAVSLCKVWCTVSSICIQHKFGLEEMKFDNHVREFEESLEIIESLLKITSDPMINPTGSTFLMQYFSQVYLIAIKCRNPQIRRRALVYLKNFSFYGSWNSGFWDARMMARVAERVVEIEEEGLEGRRDGTGSMVPSEWARIYDIRIPAQAANDSNEKIVQFRSRVDGQWALREELFKV